MSARRLLVGLCALVAATAVANPSGRSWKAPPVQYRVFNHGSGTGNQVNGITDFDAVLTEVQAAFGRWTTAGGVGCTRWDVQYAGLYTSPVGKGAINGTDGKNSVVWLRAADWTHDAATLGLTTTTFISASGEIIDADMELNNNQLWKLGGGGTALHVESIILHEAGHFLGLDHSPSSAAVMFANYAYGDIKVALTESDVNDVCGVYPTAATGRLGDFCAADAACAASAPACRGAVSAASKICTTDCTAGGTCPAGFTCQNASPSGKACLRAPGGTDLCRFCAAGPECASGVCLTDDSRRHNWCAIGCATATDCGAGFDCVDTGAGKFCAPQNNACPLNQCNSASECAPGYDCVTTAAGRMCEATGAGGARCELTGYCTNCQRCIGAAEEAYCRACCGKQGAGGTCTACGPDGVCSSGSQTACATILGDAKDQVCIPDGTGGAASCQGCDGTHPCQSGLQCLGGRCHASCNPKHPGACTACFEAVPGSGAGYCACSDGEIAYPGNACSNSTSSLVVCTNGYACSGSPATCKPTCTLGDSTTCANGQTCTNVDGKAVCVSGGVQPGGVCAPSPTGSCGPTSCAAGLTCYGGRCYTSCDPNNATACSDCVAVNASSAVCPCSDQRAAVGSACGVNASTLTVCTAPGVCTAGTCRAPCDPASPVCPAGQSCQRPGSSWVCLAAPDAGTPDAGPGPGQGPTTSAGCACSGTDGWIASGPLFLLFIGLLARRPRSARSLLP